MLCAGVRADGLAEVRALIGEFSVKIEHTQERVAASDAGKPPLMQESWQFRAGGADPVVRYSRYLNQPPEFTGSHPSLVGGHMGIGLDGGPFGNWYRGSALRLLIDGKDLFAERPADRIETCETAAGHLRMVWEPGRGRRIVLSFTVPSDGRAVFARAQIEPGEVPLESLGLRLTCYPGGFGPAYGLPSHRYVRTEDAQAEVPAGFSATPERPFPVLPLTQGRDWLFYGDRQCSAGGLALLLNSAEEPAGEVALSNYGISTSLVYPAATRDIRLAFFAYSLENRAAERAFLAGLEAERMALPAVPFWTEHE